MDETWVHHYTLESKEQCKGPPECIGAGNQSGWMTQKEFVKWIDRFMHHVKPSKEDPVLLLLDNHTSHVNVEVVNKAKNNNILLLSFPPHCSHHLQPLDVGVFGPFKNNMNRTQTSWMASNPGKVMLYMTGIVKEALPLALSPTNIINAFRKSGIWPCNEDIFQESDFAPSFVTDRPDPSDQNQPLVPEPTVDIDYLSLNLENPEVLDDVSNLDISVTDVMSQMSSESIAGPSGMQKGASDFAVETIRPLLKVLPVISDVASQMSCEPVAGPSGMQKGASDFAVETIRPLPKAPPRITSNRKRAKKSAILTDTLEKNALEKEHNIREMKKRKITSKHQNKENKKDKEKGKGKGKAKGNVNDEKVLKVMKRILNESNSSHDDDDYYCIICGASYNEDTSGGEWIECISCKDWAQAGCIKGDITAF